MAERRSQYEIYWEILTFCRAGKSFTAIINRCNLNSKTGQEHLEFLVGKGYLAVIKDGEKTAYTATEKAVEYLALFSRLYQSVFDQIPGFRL
jgi:predicted transcriptional regulator